MSVPVIYFDLGNTLVFGPSGNKEPFDDAVATIQELWTRGYRIGLLSDQPVGMTEAGVRQKLNDYGLEQSRFDVITISSEFDPPIYKPNPQVFATALSKAGHAAASDDTVFVTETSSHIEAARDLGWRAIHKPFQAACTAASGECVEDLDDLLALFPALDVDLYIRDAPGDPGDDEFTGPKFWQSPDLWIRHQQDGGTTHQPPEAGRDNWFYTRVHNRGVGIARVFSVGYAVREWAGTQFVYPGDYWPFLAFTFGGNLEPGDTKLVFTKWEAADVPPEGTHACWLVAAQIAGDLPASGAHVWEHNNLAQKNLTIVAAAPGDSGEVAIVLGSRHVREARFYRLEVLRSKRRPDLALSLITRSRRSLDKIVHAGRGHVRRTPEHAMTGGEVALRFLESARVELVGVEAQEGRVTMELERGSTLSLTPRDEPEKEPPPPMIPTMAPARLVRDEKAGAAIVFAPGRVSGIGIGLRPRQIVPTVLRFRVPDDAKPGERIDLDLVQRGEDGRIVGGVAVQVQVRDRCDEPRRPETRQPSTQTGA